MKKKKRNISKMVLKKNKIVYKINYFVYVYMKKINISLSSES